jgi:hypothetical protein
MFRARIVVRQRLLPAAIEDYVPQIGFIAGLQGDAGQQREAVVARK